MIDTKITGPDTKGESLKKTVTLMVQTSDKDIAPFRPLVSVSSSDPLLKDKIAAHKHRQILTCFDAGTCEPTFKVIEV